MAFLKHAAIVVLALSLPSAAFGLRVAARVTDVSSDLAVSGSIVNMSDIRRSGYKSWYIVRNGSGVQENMDNKTVSAKPRRISWNRIGYWNYSRSANKTKPLITVGLNGTLGTIVKVELALRFIFGGRVKQWTAQPTLFKKGRFLKKIRVIPVTYCSNSTHGGYNAIARVNNVTVRSIGSQKSPVAEAKLKVKIEYGQRRLSRAFWYKSEWEITVRGTGSYKARKLSSKGPFSQAKAGSFIQMESVSTDNDAEFVTEEFHESEDQMDKIMESDEELDSVSSNQEDSELEESEDSDVDELVASRAGKCTKRDQRIMNKMGSGSTKGKWPTFVKDCTDHSVRKFPPAWTGHSGMVNCIRQKKVSKGCATCFADMSKHGFDNCKTKCMFSWCSAGCLQCTRGNKAAHSKLVKCTGMKKMPTPKKC